MIKGRLAETASGNEIIFDKKNKIAGKQSIKQTAHAIITKSPFMWASIMSPISTANMPKAARRPMLMPKTEFIWVRPK